MTSSLETKVPDSRSDCRSESICRSGQILIVVIATLLHGVFLAKAKPLQSANDRSRWCTVWSLVERGTFQIDEIRKRPGWDTIDLIHVDDHFYSTKPPLLTSIVAGITWCVQRITGWNLISQTQSVTVAVLLIVNLIPFVLSLLAWIGILERLAAQPWTRLFLLAIAAFGTLLTPFLMTLNNHTVAAAATMIALYALVRILTEHNPAGSSWQFALCGIASSWAAVNELPAGLFLLVVFILAYRNSPRQTFIYFVPAAAFPLVALLVSNIIATGSWKPAYADYGTDKYRFVIDGIPSYWMEPHGVDRNLDSPWVYFVHCTIGHHGLISLTPIMILALAGWAISFRIRDRELKTVIRAGAFITAVVLGFYMTRTQNYNYGGVSCGLRWALWLIPLWLVAVVPVVDRLNHSMAFRSIATGLALVSMYSAWLPIDNPWRQPWLFQWMEARDWIDYSDPAPTLEKPLWSWIAALPDSSEQDPSWMEFELAQPGPIPRTVRMTARRQTLESADQVVDVEIRESGGQSPQPQSVRTIRFRVEPFERGAPPAEFLMWSDSKNVTPEQQQADLAFVRGLPRKVPYEARTIRYLKTGLRNDAFKCIQAAAHVSFAATEKDKANVHRCDVWLSDEVPFGMVQVEFHITDPESGAVLFHERWTVRDCWPKVQQ